MGWPQQLLFFQVFSSQGIALAVLSDYKEPLLCFPLLVYSSLDFISILNWSFSDHSLVLGKPLHCRWPVLTTLCYLKDTLASHWSLSILRVQTSILVHCCMLCTFGQCLTLVVRSSAVGQIKICMHVWVHEQVPSWNDTVLLPLLPFIRFLYSRIHGSYFTSCTQHNSEGCMWWAHEAVWVFALPSWWFPLLSAWAQEERTSFWAHHCEILSSWTPVPV